MQKRETQEAHYVTAHFSFSTCLNAIARRAGILRWNCVAAFPERCNNIVMTVRDRISVERQPMAIPPLEAGDHLTRAEFERRYEAMPRVKKAELIEGVVHMPSPVRWSNHGEKHASLVVWLGYYRAAVPGVRVADNASVGLDDENAVQPDVTMMLEGRHGGRATITPADYVEGSPELVAEVAASSASVDTHEKLAATGAMVSWNTSSGASSTASSTGWPCGMANMWHYRRTPREFVEASCSPAFGLTRRRCCAATLARVLDVLRQGMASAEHAAFVVKQRLARGESQP